MPLFRPAPLMLLTGKGGTGKTTCTATLAMYLAQQRKRVAVIELERNDTAALLGARRATYAGTRTAAGLTLFSLTPREAFAEYAIERLGSAALYRTIFDNRFVHYFLDATPGLNDLACLGKLWTICHSGDFDHCIVDLPATGHALSFLQVPRLITQTIHFGPLHEHGERMRTMLQDAHYTQLYAVCTPEELPITEAEHILATADTLHVPCGGIICNRLLADPLPAPLRTAWTEWAATASIDNPYRRSAAYAEQRYQRQRDAITQLMRHLTHPLWTLPDIATSDTDTLLDATLDAWTREVAS